MKTFLRVFLFSLFFIFAIGQAHADNKSEKTTYTVKKGDWLEKIARAHGTTWKILAKSNGIKNPNIIHIGQQLQITKSSQVQKVSTPSKAEMTPVLWKKPGISPCVKCGVNSSVRGLEYPKVVADALIQKVRNRDFTMIKITRGMQFEAMYFGKRVRKENVIADWRPGHTEPAREYSVIHEGKRYALIYPLVCGNWAKKTSVIPPPLAVTSTVVIPLYDTPVVEKAPEQVPEQISVKQSELICGTCPDFFIVLATFEPLRKEESHHREHLVE